MASLLSWAGHQVKRLENTVHNDVAAPIQRAAGSVVHQAQGGVAQVNPADGGRTYHTVMQQGAQYQPKPVQSAISQLTHNGATNIVGGFAKPTVQMAGQLANGAYHVATLPIETARTIGAEVTNNPSATNAGIKRAAPAFSFLKNLAQGTASTAYQLGESLNPSGGDVYQRSHTFKNPVAKAVFGSNPVPSMQKQYKDTKATSGAATAAGQAVLTSVMDALGGKAALDKVGATGLAAKGAKASAPEAVAHKGLMNTNPGYVELQKSLERSTTAANKINQEGGSKVALNQHTNNIDNIQHQMATMRSQAKSAGGRNVPASIPVPEPLPGSKGSVKVPTDTASSASRVSSSKESIPAPQVGKTVKGASSSRMPVATGGPAEVPKTSLDQASVLPNLKSDQLVQSGSKNVIKAQAERPGQSQLAPVEQQLTQNPYGQSTPVMTKERAFGQSVKSSPEVSPTVAKRAGSTYQVRNTANLANKAEAFAGGNLNKATEAVSSSLGKKRGTVSDQEVANAIAVAKRHDANNNFAQATDIYENLSKHLTAAGQSVQAASLLDRRTPEGLRFQVTKVFKKAGVTPSSEVNAAIDAKMQQIKATKPGTPERILATKELQKIVGDNLPSTPGDKAISFWKAGLLTGARTQTGNLLSNETFSILHNVSNPLAAGLDKGISLVTGQRTKTLTGKGLVSGTVEGTKRAGTYLKTGIDERSTLTNKFDSHQVNFKNKVLNTYVNGVFKLMGAADRPHYYRQLQNSLADLAKADGMNQGLRGQALSDHINGFVKDPPSGAFQTATSEAEKSVLANDTVLSRAVSKLRQSAEDAESPLGKAVTEATINLIMPFTKVPSAFISRVVDYTPVGAIKTIAGQISRKQFDQRALVTAISEATTGTGIMYLGSKLAEAKMLSGDYPSDPKEQQRWKAQGVQPNSVKVDGKWVNMNYFGPLGLLFAAGGRIADTKQQGGGWLSQQAQAYSGMPKDLTQQSFLQGLSGSLQAINEPGRYLNNYVKSQVGSVVPTLVGDIATSTDNKQRQADNPGETIKSRIPGARETLKPAQDVYGNQLDRKTGPISSLINPFRPTTDTTNRNAVIKEVSRLHGVDPTNSDLQVTPTQVGKTIRVEGQSVALSNKQRYDLQNKIGQTTQAAWDKLIKTSDYKALDDVSKAQALSNLRSTASALATRDYVTQNNLAQYSKQASAKVTALGNGSANLSDYAVSGGSTGSPSKAKTSTYTDANGKKITIPKIPKATNATVTSYDPKANIWTQTNNNTGRVTQIDSSGARTIVNKGIGAISGARPDYIANIRSSANKYKLDTPAVLAVAAAEGLGGGVGDNGTSYGPFQLHVGGALPQGKDQKWAESPAGIDYAMQQISKVAKGKKGQDAITAIVNAFERPADPNGEIARALDVYSGGSVKLTPGQARSGQYASEKKAAAAQKKVATARKQAVSTELRTLVASNKAASPIKTPARPHFSVKTTTTPSSYKQIALKQYAVQKTGISKTKRA